MTPSEASAFLSPVGLLLRGALRWRRIVPPEVIEVGSPTWKRHLKLRLARTQERMARSKPALEDRTAKGLVDRAVESIEEVSFIAKRGLGTPRTWIFS